MVASCAKWSAMAVSNTEITAVEMFVMTLSMAVLDVAVTLVGKFTAHSKPNEFNTSRSRWAMGLEKETGQQRANAGRALTLSKRLNLSRQD
ncbi:hypothetical protein J6590_086228 [Homalodisca vitripennis]|nr:hypothetical protein J6590_086228 [Homalodisca vitripennis]